MLAGITSEQELPRPNQPVAGKAFLRFIRLSLAVELIYYGNPLESHFLVGNWWQQPAGGYAGVIDIWGTSLRLESLFISETQENPSGVQVAVGVERALTEKWTASMEYYHSSFGATSSDSYLTLEPTPFRTLLTRIAIAKAEQHKSC